MIDIAKVRLLEERVRAVIARLGELNAENATLREQIAAQAREKAELERRVEEVTVGQAEIETGILNALRQLDEIEDSITEERIVGETRVDLSERSAPGTPPASPPSAAPEASVANDDDPPGQPIQPPAEPQRVEPQSTAPAPSSEDDDLELEIDPEEEEDGPELDIF